MSFFSSSMIVCSELLFINVFNSELHLVALIKNHRVDVWLREGSTIFCFPSVYFNSNLKNWFTHFMILPIKQSTQIEYITLPILEILYMGKLPIVDESRETITLHLVKGD